MSSTHNTNVLRLKELKVVLPNLLKRPSMKPESKTSAKMKKLKSSAEDDDTVRYKFNESFKNKELRLNLKKYKTPESNSDEVLYKFPDSKSQVNYNHKKTRQNNKIKVKFWSNKLVAKVASKNTITSPINSANLIAPVNKTISNSATSVKTRRSPNLSTTNSAKTSPKTHSPKIRQRVSFLPPPLFTDEHAPMVTVPDDLTVHLNEEEANDLLMTADSVVSTTTTPPRKTSQIAKLTNPPNRTSPKKRHDDLPNTDLEYFAKYVVQKLRRMETNQRIYSENLINTVLMLGQLQQLNGKSKVSET